MPSPLLSCADIGFEIEQTPGLIPVRVDSPAGEIQWLDLEQFHCYQGFFKDAVSFYLTVCGHEPGAFRSSLECLTSVGIPKNAIPPSSFIFHAGRCGSTLLTRILARSRSNIVFGEAAAHNQIWTALNEDPSAKEIYRALLTTMGRRRLEGYRAHIIKFTSYNITRFQFIRRAFPTSPALFLFREPRRLLHSYHRERAPWMGIPTGIGKVWTTPESAVEDFFSAALEVREPGFRVLEYSDLSPSLLPVILDFLNVEVSPSDLRQMQSEFLFDAKSVHPRPFEPRALPTDARGSRDCISNELRDLYARLKERASSDWQ
jgi:hypothetical protein